MSANVSASPWRTLTSLPRSFRRVSSRDFQEHRLPHQCSSCSAQRSTNRLPAGHGQSSRQRKQLCGLLVLEAKVRPTWFFLNRSPFVAQFFQQQFQFIVATVNVADKIERPVLVRAVVPQRHALNRRRVDFFDRIHHKNMPEAFFFVSAQ